MTEMLNGARHVHFVGICGAGMSALARFLAQRGVAVTGSDRAPGTQGDQLAALGVKVFAGHDADHIQDADLVVMTAAVGADNPEVRAAVDRGVPVVKRAQVLADISNAGYGVAVAGTHGKTTTSALLGWVLTHAGLDPTILIGGVSANLGSNARLGSSNLVVTEADEYDGSFLRLHPATAVITNVAPEHLDFYGTPAAVFDAFHQFATSVTEHLIVCADDPGLLNLVRDVAVPVTSYGIEAGDIRAEDVTERLDATRFTVRVDGAPISFTSPLTGRHNVRNALGVIAAASRLGVSPGDIVAAIGSFKGVARRQEIKGEVGDIVVMDDYAVHPTEVFVTLSALRDRYQRPIRVIFQPHTFSRPAAFLAEFTEAFQAAETVYVMDIYAARETETLGMSGERFAEAVAAVHPDVRYTPSAADATRAVVRDAGKDDILVTMGAGDVTALGAPILAGLASR